MSRQRRFLVGHGHVYNGVRAEVDGKTYELHYHGSKKKIRCYLIKGRTYRKVLDQRLVSDVLAKSVEIRKATEERNERITRGQPETPSAAPEDPAEVAEPAA